MTESDNRSPAEGRAERFVANVYWHWLGVIASFLTGFVVSPYIVLKLGDSRYGVWALAFSFIDYTMLLDFGFKTAVVNAVARSRAQNDTNGINEVVNTAFSYFLAIAATVLILVWGISGDLPRMFQITPVYRDDFVRLVRIIGFGWAFALASSVFVAGVEGFQQFKAQNRIYIASLILRSGGCAVALYLGFGLPTMGLIITLSQVINAVFLFVVFRRSFPELSFSRNSVKPGVWKQLASYGIHAFVAYLGGILVSQGPPILIGHFRSEAFVGYYTLPFRLVQYIVEFVTRIGYVTVPNASEMVAQERKPDLVNMGIYLNRYSFSLFAPLSVFLLVYGKELLCVWIKPSFAEQAAVLLPAFTLSTLFAVAGQFNSSQILFGLAKHGTYSRTLVAEGIAALAFMVIVLPSYGVVGVAWVAAAFALLNRGWITPYLLSRSLKFRLLGYMRAIYLTPTLAAIPVFFFGFWFKTQALPGRNWAELLIAAGLIVLPYYGACYFFVMEEQHRLLLRTSIGKRILRFGKKDAKPRG
ncbi:MAG: oligosaccharide flippase family protein [Acidobacteriales bacterium]|nr:oligosaccharide flippase family protein [Terriglobales bacterium]